MKRYRCLLVAALLAASVAPAHAGIFGKKNRPDPNQRVPELIITVKTDGDEKKRECAAEELRQYDPKQFPDIIPVLVDVLFNDKKPAVRAEAATSLGKIRPISQQVGWALEQAVEKDSSIRVRLAARSALLSYHWAGYHSSKEPPPPPQTKEPPLAPGGPPVSPMPMPMQPQPGPRVVPMPNQPAPPVINTPGPPLVPAEPPALQPAPSGGGPQL
ncbi:MAG TPA: HEAT repeat domain-containing protein [Gemmataceae bacterium]|nr:HEAT repeat domain-containing protein [Gemmataceae bacterium]